MNIARTHSFEQLLRLNRVNNSAFFLSGFSHSFNNPLNSIQLASDLLNNYTQDINALLDELNEEPERLPAGFQKECCRILTDIPILTQGISDSVTRLKHCSSWLSEFTGRGAIAGLFGVDLNWLVSHCASMAQHKISVYTNIFSLDLEPDLPVVRGNAEQMLQVILNLLMNALLSLPDRSSAIVLTTVFNSAAGSVQMCVRDEGNGISPDIFPEILEPFFSTWSEHDCMGLGLTVADQIIRNHGGKLTIDSEFGKGTSVMVSLPLQGA
jgi:signal transduction histidine kinase